MTAKPVLDILYIDIYFNIYSILTLKLYLYNSFSL